MTNTLPLLVSISKSFLSLSLIIYQSYSRIQIYDTPYQALTSKPLILISPSILITCQDLKIFLNAFINFIFNNFISLNFPNYFLVFTDGSVSSSSEGYSFYMLILSTSFSALLPHLSLRNFMLSSMSLNTSF